MKSITFTIFITVEREVEVTIEHSPAHYGHRDKYGAPEEPDEPDHCVVHKARIINGPEIELTAKEEERAVEEGFTKLSEDQEAAADAEMDAMCDEPRDYSDDNEP